MESILKDQKGKETWVLDFGIRNPGNYNKTTTKEIKSFIDFTKSKASEYNYIPQ